MFRSLDIALICLVDTVIPILGCALTHFGIVLLNIVQPVIPDGCVWIIKFALENLEKLIESPAEVSNGFLRKIRRDQVMLIFEAPCSMAPTTSSQDILLNNIDRIHLGTKSTRLVVVIGQLRRLPVRAMMLPPSWKGRV